MRILGIDYGTVRTGVAISDPTATIAQPAGFMKCDNFSNEKLADEISAKFAELKAEKIVLGLPKHMNGQERDEAKKIRLISQILTEKHKIEVVLLDERLTSKSAEKILIEGNVSREKRKTRVDSLAACIILQNYLDSQVS